MTDESTSAGTSVTMDDWERLQAAVRDVARTVDGRDVGVVTQGGTTDLVWSPGVEARGAARRVPATSAEVCQRGCHLALAYQPFHVCHSCGQPIASGAVGVATWFGAQPHRCVEGGRDFQHGCGGWNSPVEVLVEVRDRASEHDVAAARDDVLEEVRDLHDDGQLAGDDVDGLIGAAMRKIAEEAVAALLVELHDQVDTLLEERAQQRREELRRDLAAAYRHLGRAADELRDAGFDLDVASVVRLLDQHPVFHDEHLVDAAAPAAELYGGVGAAQEELMGRIAGVADALHDLRDGTEPGLAIDGSELVAWDYDPRDHTEGSDIIEVVRADVDLVDADEATRVDG